MLEEKESIAALDLGSNSFHMVVAQVDDQRPVVIDTLKEMVRLRDGLAKDGTLSQEAQDRALACLKRFEQRLRDIPPKNIRVVGTNTLRGARNTAQLLRDIQTLLGAPVEIIAGREEARLIYLGVINQLPTPDQRNLVVDIGGGSTEFIVGEGFETKTLESRPMGCVSFTKEYFPDGRLSRRRFNDAVKQVLWLLEPHRQLFKRKNWDVAIGTSGTAKATAGILREIGEGRNTITRQGLEILIEKVLAAKKIDQLNLPGLKPERAPVYPGGLAILYGVFQAFKIDQMRISYQSLREGVIWEMVGRDTSDIRFHTIARMMSFYKVDKRQAEAVRDFALKLFPQIQHALLHEETLAEMILRWAAELHEIGLAIAHPNYHRHGAYILLNADMAGFSRVGQGLLSFLVMNHRKSLKNPELPLENELDWALLFVLRLAVIFHRERRYRTPPDLQIDWNVHYIRLAIPKDWLEAHPLTRADLEMEQNYWRKIGYEMELEELT